MAHDDNANPAEYRGVHLEKHTTEKERRKRWTHKIFLFNPDFAGTDEEMAAFVNNNLNQIVKVHEHTIEDFEFNAKKIIEYYRSYYGDMTMPIVSIGQTISFKVHPDQKKPFELPLFKFFVNYTMLILPIIVGMDMRKWRPWTPERFTSSAWCSQMDHYIKQTRSLANMRRICECLEWSKHLMNLWAYRNGDRLGLSISNNEFIELMKRNKNAYESITCTFDIPDNISPTDLETLTANRTDDLLKFISEQRDLSMSVYARNGLFNPAQFREYAVHETHKPGLDGSTIPYTYPTNIIMGINDPRAFMVDGRGGRKAEITKLNVSDAGMLERSLMMLMAPIRFVDVNYECNSRHFRKRYIQRRSDLKRLDGRVFTRDPSSNEFWILDPDTMPDLIGETIYMKTPITCTHPRRKEGYICSACYGKLMANLNCDIHVGRIAAAECADDMEQKLLSAKHALKTNTNRIEFEDEFYRFFELGNGQISLGQDMIDMSQDDGSDFYHYHLEFYPATMGKHQDGESRHYDRSFGEIVIWNDRDDSRITITEKNNAPLYLSPEFNNDYFLPALHYHDTKDMIRIPLSDLCDTGELTITTLFEFTYKNNELASPLLTLERMMFNMETINSFDSYDDCLDAIIPLFAQGGIHVPDYQTEMLVSQLVHGPDGSPVDWNDPNPTYKFMSISKSIAMNDSALTSVLYRDATQQIAGSNGTYEKTGTSSYDYFILETEDEHSMSNQK